MAATEVTNARRTVKVRRKLKPVDGSAGVWGVYAIETHINLEIDIEALLLELAEKALNNKSGKTRALGGLIRVRVRELAVHPIE